VPAYNEEKTIEKVLDELIEHAPSVFEIIVVDDGSKDQTGAIVDT
jgi:glycosyltransferase involved in cell wall biosynthesis